MTFIGYLDGIHQAGLNGWCKGESKDLVPTIEILCNGNPVYETTAINFRQDLLDAGVGDGHHAFTVPVATLLAHLGSNFEGLIEFAAVVKETGYELSNSPIILDYDMVLSLGSADLYPNSGVGISEQSSTFPSELMKLPTRPRVLICGGVPCSDVGGGQRSAQLARAFKARSWEVVYTYMYPAIDTSTGEIIESGSPHYVIDQRPFESLGPKEWLKFLQKGDLIVVEIPHRKYIELLDFAAAAGITTIYEIIDDWESSLGGDWYSSGSNLRAAEAATITTYTAKILEVGNGLHSLYEPNAVDLDIFDPYKQYLRPSDLPDNGMPNFLYFGSLYGEWFWWDALVAAAELNKDANFVLIGHPPKDVPKRTNIFYLGGKQNEELPGYTRWSDFAICPFKPGKIAEAVSPVKIFEYLAMHKPSVMSGVVDTRFYPGVMFATKISEFSDMCGRLISGRVSLPRPVDFDVFAIKNSWQARIESMLVAVESAQLDFTWPSISKSRSPDRPLFSVIILCHNNRDVIWRCITSLQYYFGKDELEIIVVDNVSTDGSYEILQSLPDLKILRNDKNGCSSGRNLGMAAATGKYISFLDSDQYICGRAWLTDAADALEKFPTVGVIGWAAGWFTQDWSAGPIAEYMPLKGRDVWHDRRGFRTDVGYLGTGGMVLRSHQLSTFGKFDEFYDPTCFEDTDWSLRIKSRGYQLAYMRSPTLLHQSHQTTNAAESNIAYQNLFERNQKYLIEKFKDSPEIWEPLWR